MIIIRPRNGKEAPRVENDDAQWRAVRWRPDGAGIAWKPGAGVGSAACGSPCSTADRMLKSAHGINGNWINGLCDRVGRKKHEASRAPGLSLQPDHSDDLP